MSTSELAVRAPALEQRYRVEVGEYPNPTLAEALASDLRRRGYAVHVRSSPPYGVTVGGGLDRLTAERLVGLLSAAGFDAVIAH